VPTPAREAALRVRRPPARRRAHWSIAIIALGERSRSDCVRLDAESRAPRVNIRGPGLRRWCRCLYARENVRHAEHTDGGQQGQGGAHHEQCARHPLNAEPCLAPALAARPRRDACLAREPARTQHGPSHRGRRHRCASRAHAGGPDHAARRPKRIVCRRRADDRNDLASTLRHRNTQGDRDRREVIRRLREVVGST
jgi:hypothetical protein